MQGELILNGKKYISSKRLSEISNYTSDYISRLCRENAIDGQLVGRSWFVDPDSLFAHKKNQEEKVEEKNIADENIKKTEHNVTPLSQISTHSIRENVSDVISGQMHNIDIRRISESQACLRLPAQTGSQANDAWDSELLGDNNFLRSDLKKSKKEYIVTRTPIQQEKISSEYIISPTRTPLKVVHQSRTRFLMKFILIGASILIIFVAVSFFEKEIIFENSFKN